ncbi:hypothetical protein [Cellulomonas oligotrophica]|uniref:HicB family protein n=1 Tax=Cellulomonas oligotrophica TaxID=931536 RepID=A0A7Y9FGR4_9CELL|nr:hypothetical protein [Cellulomonas oligotrophica]NYD87040.1 hypothetical protein [Cellulomonas oligotrophica]GIG32174.1 hypothetical protein Col01nite_13330 [Cellulomonas oligotrophica]
MSEVYTATATRQGRWWIVSVPAVDGLTQALHLDDVAQAAAELVAVALDVPVEGVRVEVVTVPGDGR